MLLPPSIVPISIPNPYFEGSNTVYLIQDDPLTLIDTGIATEQAYRSLAEGLRRQGVSVAKVERIVLTHKHVDHIGNAWRVQQESGATIYIHTEEVAAVRDVEAAAQQQSESIARLFRRWRVPPTLTRELHRPDLRRWEIQSAACCPLRDNDILPAEHWPLQVMHTPGHTMGSICLRSGSLLFTGDHILRDTSPNIGAGDPDHRGLLGLYYCSLRNVSELPGHPTALPGHGEPFGEVAARCATLQRHHDDRLRDALRLVQRPAARAIYDIAVDLFGSLDGLHIFLGCAEAQSHLDLLVERGAVELVDDHYRAR
jgi:glyoxylase-like metal-dependent hydrolase (beta-lactamase superfamily II)